MLSASMVMLTVPMLSVTFFIVMLSVEFFLMLFRMSL
jgi:hypothetical protein